LTEKPDGIEALAYIHSVSAVTAIPPERGDSLRRMIPAAKCRT
jgi:hypothetical protein